MSQIIWLKLTSFSEGKVNLLRCLGLLRKNYRQIIIQSKNYRTDDYLRLLLSRGKELVSGILCDSWLICIDLKTVAGVQCTTYLIPSKLMIFSELLFANVISVMVKAIKIPVFSNWAHTGKGTNFFPPILTNRGTERPFIGQANPYNA